MNKTEILNLGKEVATELIMNSQSDYQYSDILNNLNTHTPIHTKFQSFVYEMINNKEAYAELKGDIFWGYIDSTDGTYLTFKIYGNELFSPVLAPLYRRWWRKLRLIKQKWLELKDIPFETVNGELVLGKDWFIFWKGTKYSDIVKWFKQFMKYISDMDIQEDQYV